MSAPPVFSGDCDDSSSDFIKISGNVASNISYKLGIFMFFIGMLVFSDIFNDSILHNIKGSMDLNTPNTQGTIIQLTVFVLLMLIVDLMIKYEWV